MSIASGKPAKGISSDRRRKAARKTQWRSIISPTTKLRQVNETTVANVGDVAPLERSRSRQNINFNSTRAPVAKELNYETEPHSSTTRSKVSGKQREPHAGPSNRDKESELAGCPAKGESDVEALLARLRAL
ncbi:DIAP3 protein, partial [Polypterus senegalus]